LPFSPGPAEFARHFESPEKWLLHVSGEIILQRCAPHPRKTIESHDEAIDRSH
jgi:hypothetical protein